MCLAPFIFFFTSLAVDRDRMNEAAGRWLLDPPTLSTGTAVGRSAQSSLPLICYLISSYVLDCLMCFSHP